MIYNITVDNQKIFMNNKAVQKFGQNMKRIREAKKMSQGDIYRATKIERAYISNLEAGKQNPTLETMEKIAKALGVNVEQLQSNNSIK